MSETQEHKNLKEIIANVLKINGYKVEIEHRIGKSRYDIVAWNKEGKARFIEIFLYPVRLNFLKPNIFCPKCKYEWNTNSKLDSVTCPNCQKKFKREKKDGK